MSEEKENPAHTIQKALAAAGFEMNVWGCGCCDSPCIKLHYKGEFVAESEGQSFDMIKDKDD